MANLTVTAAIPVYNGAEFIGPTIESLINQTRKADEILVVDDGSTDQTVEICSNYPIRVVEHKSNLGLATARNTAVEEASSDIIVFVDVDALADKELLQIVFEAYGESDIGGVGGQGIESNIHSPADRWRKVHASQGHGDLIKEVDHLFGLCMSYPVSVLEEIGGFNPEFRTNGEDVDAGLRVRAAGYRLLYLPKAVVYHQRSDDVESLLQTMANWYTAGYRAKKKNNASPWRLYLGVIRHSVSDIAHDLIFERDMAMALLSCRVNWAKLRALRIASSS